MGVILVNGIRVFAYHGCMPEEAVIGGEYLIDVEVETDFSEAIATDELEHTVDYVKITELVQREMAVRSRLIEEVGHRIINALRETTGKNDKIKLKLTKVNPPIEADVQSVSVVMTG